MESSYITLDEAKDINLVTLYEVKVALDLTSSTTQDDRLEVLIKWASDEIATMCGRIFAKEKVQETFRDVGYDKKILPLSHYPVLTVNSVTDAGEDISSSEYEINVKAGTIYLIDGYWTGPVVVTYNGGYELPNKAPMALSQATMLLVKDNYYSLLRGDSSIRMIAHKESRIMYYDPNSALRATGGGGGSVPGSGNAGSPTRRAVNDLLRRYQRIEV